MRNISYHYNASGTLVGVWPGKSVSTDNGPRKEGQQYLGKVINKELRIFWTREEGYYQFNPEDLSHTAVDERNIPSSDVEQDGSRKNGVVFVDFGDSYFLDTLIKSMGYDKVLDAIQCRNRDCFYAMLFYYVLEGAANVNAESWYRQNYARYLFPKANVYSQRISDLLNTLGDDSQRRNFLIAHIRYLLESTDEEVSILIDSTGMPNKCSLPITRVSNHQGDVNIEFRMIALVQKSTGLPIFYEIIPGNIVDVSTTQRIIEVAKQYHCNVDYAIGDAGYCCPSVMEKLVLAGIDFMTRLNPAYDLFTKVAMAHRAELNDTSHIVRYKGRLVSIVKIQSQIAVNKESGEPVDGYIYLCKDLEANASKFDHLLKTKAARYMTRDELVEMAEKFGIFAIVTTKNLPETDVLPEYYIRQGIEQYFDFGKNCAKFLPVREHNMRTLNGHMLLSFIATFLIIVIKNRLGIVDTDFVQVSPALTGKTTAGNAKNTDIEEKLPSEPCKSYIEQMPVKDAFESAPTTLFLELRGQKAEVFDNVIIPQYPVRQANDFYYAFRLVSPFLIKRDQDNLTCQFRDGEENRLTRKYVFACKPSLTEDEIKELRKKKEQSKAQAAADKAGLKVVKNEPKRGPGRPKGSKNKKTLEREAAEAAAAAAKKHRGPGRPKGSLNKKTLARMAAEKAAAEHQTTG